MATDRLITEGIPERERVLRDDLRAARDQVTASEENLARVREFASASAMASSAKLAEAEEQIADLVAKNSKLENVIEGHREDRCAQDAAIAQLTEQNQGLQQQVTSLEQQKGDLIQAVSRAKDSAVSEFLASPEFDLKLRTARAEARAEIVSAGIRQGWLDKAGYDGHQGHVRPDEAAGTSRSTPAMAANPRAPANPARSPPVRSSAAGRGTSRGGIVGGPRNRPPLRRGQFIIQPRGGRGGSSTGGGSGSAAP